jgi:hypothetical protein|mmetsp:Transcript_2266/g.6768  ORF Transcript_2266/g.6768 Transcript_2266/m.6768 type:complete len:80 (+) Transcript_2266:2437-2676(+)
MRPSEAASDVASSLGEPGASATSTLRLGAIATSDALGLPPTSGPHESNTAELEFIAIKSNMSVVGCSFGCGTCKASRCA